MSLKYTENKAFHLPWLPKRLSFLHLSLNVHLSQGKVNKGTSAIPWNFFMSFWVYSSWTAETNIFSESLNDCCYLSQGKINKRHVRSLKLHLNLPLSTFIGHVKSLKCTINRAIHLPWIPKWLASITSESRPSQRQNKSLGILKTYCPTFLKLVTSGKNYQ